MASGWVGFSVCLLYFTVVFISTVLQSRSGFLGAFLQHFSLIIEDVFIILDIDCGLFYKVKINMNILVTPYFKFFLNTLFMFHSRVYCDQEVIL